MDVSKLRESKNFEDHSGDPWYTPDKLLTSFYESVLQPIVDPERAKTVAAYNQANQDQPVSHVSMAEAKNTRVEKAQRGWNIKTPGAVFNEYAPGTVPDQQMNAAIADLLRRHLPSR